jgi:hypothetical protein
MEHEGPLLCIQELSTSPISRVTFRNEIIDILLSLFWKEK